MENTLPDFTNPLKEYLKKSIPESTKFAEFIQPFFLLVENDYEKYLKILEKIGIKNGINGMIEMLTGTADYYLKEIDTLIHGLTGEIETRYENKSVQPTKQEFSNSIKDLRSFEGTTSYGKKMYASGYSYIRKQFSEIDKNANELPEDERKIYDAFCSYLLQLYMYYTIINVRGMGASVKEFLLSYFKGINTFYDTEKIPNQLITYLENIIIPESIEPENSNPEPKGKLTEQIPIPAFQQVKDICNVLEKYFDDSQQEALHLALKAGVSQTKLVFKGNGNQLADAFKRLYTANLVTRCTKEDLIIWIINIFEYRNKAGKYIPFTERYLNNILSTEKTPCKNPIIEIIKDGEGKTKLITPDRIGRKQE